MTEFVRYTLEDGSEVLFESDSASLFDDQGGEEEIADHGRLQARFARIASTAQELAASTRATVTGVDELTMKFGVKVSGKVGWYFVKAQGESVIEVTLTWRRGGTAEE
ncbi:hypothetical protein D0T12_21315 [Actinomadura spongiicola]|uniref:Trypsin-co-occurring domain-containing protein n=1 Tax=Actinomadura spongiicola TaxID=2303421 RepID=A0A372GDX2_9ACTN|nr:CU044_2847 family protein [Actinomadura spongiicola]RFS83575.1 hypothetical protein D0T12_21315 [Actinomadura spongiicola]